MSLKPIGVEQARKLIESGAVLVDIREPAEHAREHIAGARSLPASALPGRTLETGGAQQVIFHCRSGARTASNAARLSEAARCEAYVLEGGLDAWKKAGLPVSIDRRQPLEIMRQVQLVAGGLVVLGVLLGALVSPWYTLLSGLVGAGLVFAGATGHCGLAALLQRLPWNRPSAH